MRQVPHRWDGSLWTCLGCGEKHPDPCTCPCHTAVISGHDNVKRWMDLAAKVSQAATNEEALQIMRDATGLTMTDPDADRAEINRRTQQD